MKTMRQRSALVRVAEMQAEPEATRGDYILGAIGIVGCVAILILNWLGLS